MMIVIIGLFDNAHLERLELAALLLIFHVVSGNIMYEDNYQIFTKKGNLPDQAIINGAI